MRNHLLPQPSAPFGNDLSCFIVVQERAAVLHSFRLFHIQYQSFQIFPFWVVDVDGVVGWLVQLMKYAHVAPRLGCCGEHGCAELVFVDCLRATEGEQDATWLYLFKSLFV